MRVRVLDLPFKAVEWAMAGEAGNSEGTDPAGWMVLQRSPHARERSMMGYELGL
jgi:hypothetical protein